jgi:hypothetical protein
MATGQGFHQAGGPGMENKKTLRVAHLRVVQFDAKVGCVALDATATNRTELPDLRPSYDAGTGT